MIPNGIYCRSPDSIVTTFYNSNALFWALSFRISVTQSGVEYLRKCLHKGLVIIKVPMPSHRWVFVTIPGLEEKDD
jgi:hypothetical protein